MTYLFCCCCSGPFVLFLSFPSFLFFSPLLPPPHFSLPLSLLIQQHLQSSSPCYQFLKTLNSTPRNVITLSLVLCLSRRSNCRLRSFGFSCGYFFRKKGNKWSVVAIVNWSEWILRPSRCLIAGKQYDNEIHPEQREKAAPPPPTPPPNNLCLFIDCSPISYSIGKTRKQPGKQTNKQNKTNWGRWNGWWACENCCLLCSIDMELLEFTKSVISPHWSLR